MLDIFTSQIFLTCWTAWIAAHVVKFIIKAYKHELLALKDFFSSGGFPSGHTTLVAALFFATGIETSWDLILANITGIFAIIVIYDAVNVRFQAGLHAKALNELDKKHKFLKNPLKEALGHTYFEVIGGLILAISAVILSYYVISPV